MPDGWWYRVATTVSSAIRSKPIQVGSINPAVGVYDRIVLKIKAPAKTSGSAFFIDDLSLSIRWS